MKRNFAFKAYAVVVAAGFLFIALWCVRYPFADIPLRASPIQFDITAGSSLRSATHQMVQAGALPSAVPFEILTRLFGDPRNIKAGNYEIERGISPLDLMRKLTRGGAAALSITLVEG